MMKDIHANNYMRKYATIPHAEEYHVMKNYFYDFSSEMTNFLDKKFMITCMVFIKLYLVVSSYHKYLPHKTHQSFYSL